MRVVDRLSDRLRALDDRVLPLGRWVDRLEGPADLDAAAVWAMYDDGERARARRMAAGRDVAGDPHLALVIAGLIDRVLERRERVWPWALAGFAALLVVVGAASVLAGSAAGAIGALLGGLAAPSGWLLQADLYDRARRRNLAVARAAGLR